MVRHVDAGVLSIGYDDHGPTDAPAVVLLHGFPYDAHAYDDVVPLLVNEGQRVVVPYLVGAYLYKRSNRFWRFLIRHDLVQAVWRPLVELTRLRHMRFRASLEEP